MSTQAADPQKLAARVRQYFEAATFLRTYSIPEREMDREHLFDSEMPWRPDHGTEERRLENFLAKTGLVVTERRNRRMTIGFKS